MSSLSYKVLYLDRAVRTEHGGTYSLDGATRLLKTLKRRGFTGNATARVSFGRAVSLSLSEKRQGDASQPPIRSTS
jgi:hypothetical protein